MARYRVSMDIEGTFTDVVTYDDETGTLSASKASTTPEDLSEGVMTGLGAMVAAPGDGFVSVEAAAQDYGVAVDAATFEVDVTATEQLRERL